MTIAAQGHDVIRPLFTNLPVINMVDLEPTLSTAALAHEFAPHNSLPPPTSPLWRAGTDRMRVCPHLRLRAPARQRVQRQKPAPMLTMHVGHKGVVGR